MFLFIAIIILLFATGAVWRARRWRTQQQLLRQQLRSWAMYQSKLEPAVQQWILRLSESELQVLLGLLSGYCASLNWELGWLFMPQIEKAPALKVELEESVNAYAQSILRGLQMEEDVRAYKIYLAFDKKPKARKHRTLVTQLYRKISSQGTAAPANKLFRWVRRKKVSRQQQVEVIRQAFERDPAGTMALLKETLVDEADETVQRVIPEPMPPVLTVPTSTAA